MTDTPKLALSARFARVLAFATITAAVLGPLLAKVGVLSPMRSFLMFALALPFAVAAILLGLVGLFDTRRSTGKAGARSAFFAVLVGFVTLLVIGSIGRSGSDAPAIHDITTNLNNPPAFSELADAAANQGVDLSFPHGPDNTVELHKEAYSDLSSMHLMRSPTAVFEQAKAVATDLGWTLVADNAPSAVGPAPVQPTGDDVETEPAPQPVQATIEATATSSIFGFVDDIVIRIEGPDGLNASHSMVDIRSKSRDGQSDLGANAKRIRAFIEALNSAS